MLSIEDVAKLMDISLKSVRREIASGRLKSSKLKNRYMINENDYNEWKGLDKTDTIKTFTRNNSDVINWVDISDKMQKMDGWNHKEDLEDINFIDLFAGAGGLSCGLVMSGLKPVGSIEIMKEAVETYKRNFCVAKGFDENVETRDIRQEYVKQDLINKVKNKHIHLIVGGFPCQGFSMAGNRIVDDSRNSLYREMLSIVSHIKPDFVLMENVEGLRSMLNGQVEKKIISDYEAIGYKINVTVLNAADYGVPQTRKRVIFIGNRLGLKNMHPQPIYKQSDYKTVKDGIERFLNLNEDKTLNHEFTKHKEEMIQRLSELPQGESLYKNYTDAWKRVFWNMPSPTVKENHGGVNVHPLLSRVMTARELAALQSFPDDFIFEGSKKWQLVQIGNAVPPLLGKAIGLAIKEVLKLNIAEDINTVV